MRERPILFSGEMVRAILAGRKTQTRRIVKASGVALRYSKRNGMDATPRPATGRLVYRDGEAWDDSELRTQPISVCPYGKPGDRLWVRETFFYATGSVDGGPDLIHYRADADRPEFKGFWKPSIFMPRAASRITLEVTEVRVQRLQEISYADCMAEGCEPRGDCAGCTPISRQCTKPGDALCPHFGYTYKLGYQSLWESINGPGSWDANPWTWAITFKSISGAAVEGEK